ncbi:MAG: hypothetical protein ABI885_17390 [Gammaproteobacteria bacterium]
MAGLPWWLSISPVLLTLLSFSVFLGDLRRVGRDGQASLTKAGRWLFAIGYAGLVGTLIVSLADLRGESDRQKREKVLADQVSTLLVRNEAFRAANQEGLQLQRKLLAQNRELSALTVELSTAVAKQSNELSVLKSVNERIAAQGEEVAGFAEEQVALTRRSALLDEERDRKEKQCAWAKQFMTVEIQQRVYGCY